MKTKWQKIKDVMSWVVLVAMIGLLILSVMNAVNARKTGESMFLFGYRPVLVLTGSMEPYMMTNGLALTKEVTDISQLEIGDVVTYHVKTDADRLIRITHRVVDIQNDLVYTKGDNNSVADGYPLTMDNIEAEVVAVFNQTAWIAAKWQTTLGKIMIISFSVALICLFLLLDNMLKSRRQAKQQPAAPELADAAEAAPQVEPAQSAPASDPISNTSDES